MSALAQAGTNVWRSSLKTLGTTHRQRLSSNHHADVSTISSYAQTHLRHHSRAFVAIERTRGDETPVCKTARNVAVSATSGLGPASNCVNSGPPSTDRPALQPYIRFTLISNSKWTEFSDQKLELPPTRNKLPALIPAQMVKAKRDMLLPSQDVGRSVGETRRPARERTTTRNESSRNHGNVETETSTTSA